jgi:hypothetical protein
MKRYITDLEGKQIEITDIDKGIQQADMFSKFAIQYINQKSYWEDMLNKLKELKAIIEAEPKPEPIKDNVSDDIPQWVKEVRLSFINSHKSSLQYNTPDGHKLFVKSGEITIKQGGKITRLYGIHSCVKSEWNINVVNQLKVGQTWYRGWGNPSLTRIF